MTWSILGMMNHPHFRVKIYPLRTENGLALSFKHPATIEDQRGWMIDEAEIVNPVKNSSAATKDDSKLAALPKYTMLQVAEHNTKKIVG